MRYFSSCGCCALRTGVIAYAIYAIIAGILAIIGISIAMASDDPQIKDGKECKWRENNPNENSSELNAAQFFVSVMSKLPPGTMIFLLVSSVMGILFSVLLLYGAYKRLPKLIFPWLVLCGISMAIQLISMFVVIIFGQIGGGLMYLPGLLLSYLIFHCVLSYYKELTQSSSPPSQMYGQK